MSFELALRLTEIGVALALIQRGAEHLAKGEWRLFAPQVALSLLLLGSLAPGVATIGLWALGLAQLHRFQGPYNGGSDKMALLILSCLVVAHSAPGWAELALAYLAVQLVLSYFVSGWVKLRNHEWRNGQALSDVFAFSAYPVSERLRGLSGNTRLMRAAAWGVIGFEIAFPLTLLHPGLLVLALMVAAAFHLANACLFGLNRFLWIWLAAYPSLIWFETRLPV